MAQSIDFKDLPNAPAPVQLGVCVVIVALMVAGAWYALWSDQWADLEAKKSAEVSKHADWRKEAEKAVNLQGYKDLQVEACNRFKKLVSQLPAKAEMESVITQVNQAGIGRGLQFDLFKPSAEIMRQEMAEQPIELQISGKYHDLAAFSSDIGKLPLIVTLGDISLETGTQAQSKTSDAIINFKATARTYRYLSAGEKVAAKAASSPNAVTAQASSASSVQVAADPCEEKEVN